jgi:hypothetical protein
MCLPIQQPAHAVRANVHNTAGTVPSPPK